MTKSSQGQLIAQSLLQLVFTEDLQHTGQIKDD